MNPLEVAEDPQIDTIFSEHNAAFLSACDVKAFRRASKLLTQMLCIAFEKARKCNELKTAIFVNYLRIRYLPDDEELAELEYNQILEAAGIFLTAFFRNYQQVDRYLRSLQEAIRKINWRRLKSLTAGHPNYRKAKILLKLRKDLKKIRQSVEKSKYALERMARDSRADLMEEKLTRKRKTKKYRPKNLYNIVFV